MTRYAIIPIAICIVVYCFSFVLATNSRKESELGDFCRKLRVSDYLMVIGFVFPGVLLRALPIEDKGIVELILIILIITAIYLLLRLPVAVLPWLRVHSNQEGAGKKRRNEIVITTILECLIVTAILIAMVIMTRI